MHRAIFGVLVFFGVVGSGISGIWLVANPLALYFPSDISEYVQIVDSKGEELSEGYKAYLHFTVLQWISSILLVVLGLLAWFVFEKKVVYNWFSSGHFLKKYMIYRGDVGNFLQTIYPNEADNPRVCVVAASTVNKVRENFDVEQVVTVKIQCIADTLHFWRYWIDFDVALSSEEVLNKLECIAIDKSTGKRLEVLPFNSSSIRAEFAIYFPEMKKNETKEIQLRLVIPKYFLELKNKKQMDYLWDYSTNPSTPANMLLRFEFPTSIKSIHAELRAPSSNTARLTSEINENSKIWVYLDSAEKNMTAQRRIKFTSN